jgi:hypothetical protein
MSDLQIEEQEKEAPKKLNLKERKAIKQENELFALNEVKEEYNTSVNRVKEARKLLKKRYVLKGTYVELQEKMKSMNHEIKNNRANLFKRRNEMFYYREKYYKMLHKLEISDRLETMKNEIQEMKKNERVIAKNNKKQAKKFDLKYLTKLPKEIEDLIGQFLPYEIRNVLIENRRPFSIFKNLAICTLKSFLMHICSTDSYISLLSDDEKSLQIYDANNVETWYPDWLRYEKRECIETKILHIFHTFKRENPKAAYELMRMFSVLINPTKKYNSYDGNWPGIR